MTDFPSAAASVGIAEWGNKTSFLLFVCFLIFFFWGGVVYESCVGFKEYSGNRKASSYTSHRLHQCFPWIFIKMAYCNTSTSRSCYKIFVKNIEKHQKTVISLLLLLLLCIFIFILNLVCFRPGVIATGGDVHVRVWAVHFFCDWFVYLHTVWANFVTIIWIYELNECQICLSMTKSGTCKELQALWLIRVMPEWLTAVVDSPWVLNAQLKV